ELELLDDERASAAIAIPFSHIFTSDLRIWARRTDAASFFVRGNLYVLKDEDYEGFEREFDPEFDDDERSGFGDRDFAEIEIGFVMDEPTEIGNRSNILRITASEEFGAYLLDRLVPLLPNVANNSLLADLTLISEGEVDLTLQTEQIAQLDDTEVCIRCDLRGADLSGLDLDDANLEGSNLAGANLQETELEDVYLVGANLDGANLTDADLSGGRLTYASLENSDLTRADLNVVNFQQANLTGATLTEATLGGGNLDYSNLTNADFTDADLTRFTAVGFIPFLGLDRFRLYTTLRNVQASGAIFQNADLTRTRLDGADLTEANFAEANVDTTDFTGAVLTGAIANGVDFTDAKLCNTTLPDGRVNTQDCELEEEVAESGS
ncbi:MAG: pentapeptide repeat-containing protein, partial [Cyanothece sp. SIO2G6]|nr:pentapeptide repeat-containing protein [Cyanothece sp. SIO2G6]